MVRPRPCKAEKSVRFRQRAPSPYTNASETSASRTPGISPDGGSRINDRRMTDNLNKDV